MSGYGGRPSSSPFVPKKTWNPQSSNKRAATGDPRQFYNGPSTFEIIGYENRGKGDPLMLINRTAFFDGAERRRRQEWNAEEPTVARHSATSESHRPKPDPDPSTTYKPSTHKPHPYDNVTMLPHPARRTRTLSRALDGHVPSHFSQYAQSTIKSYQNFGGETHGGYRSTDNEMSGLLPVTSNSTKIFYKSPVPQVENSQLGFRSSSGYVSFANFSTKSTSSVSVIGGAAAVEPTWDRQSRVIQRSYATTDQNDISETDRLRKRIATMRPWEYTTLGKLVGDGKGKHCEALIGGGTRFTLLTYNILAQTHLETHRSLYKHCVPEALEWNERAHLILKEIDELSPDIICLQEVETAEFYETFLRTLDHAGYRGIFKQRTNEKPDGCAIFWSKDMFTLVGKLGVDYYQPTVPLLDRDNVALMVKLELKLGRTQQRLVVATTHLLYNPKRNDVKLAQAQLLLAELDRFSFCGYGRSGENLYHPMIVCGDFNTEPYGPVVSFITEGYHTSADGLGLTSRPHKTDAMFKLLPPSFGVSDQCQHYRIQLERFRLWKMNRRNQFDVDRKTQRALISIKSSELKEAFPKLMPGDEYDSLSVSSTFTTDENWVSTPNPFDEAEHEQVMDEMMSYGLECSFGSGTLTHGLKLRNIYAPKLDRKENNENVATTKHASWTCADFIFQGMQWSSQENRPIEGNLKLIRRLGLLTRNQCKELGPLPNPASPSDHYPLAAEFLLK